MTAALQVSEALYFASLRLKAAKVDTAALDARLLMQEALHCAPEDLIRDPNQPLSEEAHEQFCALVDRRAAREPISQILGRRGFWRHEFTVTSDVLTPRPETEVIIEEVLKHEKDLDAPLRMLDLGTGSGCLLISLLSEYVNATGVGVDISLKALAVARHNAKISGMGSRAKWQRGNWADGVDEAFDVIVCNPPYIPEPHLHTLDPEVREYEPHHALFAGEDGLACYHVLALQLKPLMKRDGVALFEVGAGQAEEVAKIFADAGLQVKAPVADLAGIPRVVIVTH